MLHQRRHQETARCPRGVSTARNYYFLCDVIYVATPAWLSLLSRPRAPFEVPKERKKTRSLGLPTSVTLAPNRGSLGVLLTYSSSVVVLSRDLTHGNTQKSTQAQACRVTLTPSRSTLTNTRSPRPRIKHTLLHKDINLTKHTSKSRQNCNCCLAIYV